jgi:hypothetical protein
MREGVLRVSGEEIVHEPNAGQETQWDTANSAQLTPIPFEVRSCILVRVVAMTSAGNGCPIENRLVMLPTKLFVCVQGGSGEGRRRNKAQKPARMKRKYMTTESL